jgi:hypothetical protein
MKECLMNEKKVAKNYNTGGQAIANTSISNGNWCLSSLNRFAG